MRGQASVFSGQSGTGKSSLINAIVGTTLPTNKTVAQTKKGSHTTTVTQLLHLDFGGWCIDTPALRALVFGTSPPAKSNHTTKRSAPSASNATFPTAATPTKRRVPSKKRSQQVRSVSCATTPTEHYANLLKRSIAAVEAAPPVSSLKNCLKKFEAIFLNNF